jgi:hypothetical protein
MKPRIDSSQLVIEPVIEKQWDSIDATSLVPVRIE